MIEQSLSNTFDQTLKMNPEKALKLDRGEPEPEMPVAASALASWLSSSTTILFKFLQKREASRSV